MSETSSVEQTTDKGKNTGYFPRIFRGWFSESGISRWTLGFIIEALLIVFSVLLALAVNEWRAEKARAQEAQTALQAIHSELEANGEEFKEAYQHHSAKQDTLMYYRKQDETPPLQLLSGGLFNPATINNTAWEMAKQSGIIDYFDYELVLDLSALYQRQAEYKDLGNAITQNFYVKVTMDKDIEEVLQDNYENWIVLLGDFSRRERGFSEANHSLLENIEKTMDE